MRSFKRIFCCLLAVMCLLSVCSIQAFAAYSSVGSFTQDEGGILGIGSSECKYYVYKDSASWYYMMHQYDVCPPIYHTKNSGTTSLTYSQSISYGSQTSYSFSTAAGGTAGSKAVNGTVTFTGANGN